MRTLHTPAARAGRRAAAVCLALLGLCIRIAQAEAVESGHDTLRIPPQEELQAHEINAVPGRVNRLSFWVQCRTQPPAGRCSSGTLVARFAMRPTQTVGQVWTDTGATCTSDLYYLACPMQSRPDGGGQRVSFEYSVDASEYADNAGTVEGRDGFVLPLSGFVIRMKGQGTLRLQRPDNVVVSESYTGGTTTLSFDNLGPSLNRGVTLLFGPFPDYLRPVVLSDDTSCRTQQSMVVCDSFDLEPGPWHELLIAVFADRAMLPEQLPVASVIPVVGLSTLAESRSEFLAVVLHDEPDR